MPRLFSIAAICCIALMIAACGEEAPQVVAPESAAEQPADQKALAAAAAMEATKGMADGVPNGGKPGAPVQLKYELQGTPAKGAAIPIDIAIVPQADTSSMRVSFIATDGLTLADDSPAEFSDAVADGVYRHTLTAMPSAEGEYYVGVIVVMSMTNGPEARTFNIPVLVGEAAKARAAASKKAQPPVDATGQPIQSMPGETDSSPRTN